MPKTRVKTNEGKKYKNVEMNFSGNWYISVQKDQNYGWIAILVGTAIQPYIPSLLEAISTFFKVK